MATDLGRSKGRSVPNTRAFAQRAYPRHHSSRIHRKSLITKARVPFYPRQVSSHKLSPDARSLASVTLPRSASHEARTTSQKSRLQGRNSESTFDRPKLLKTDARTKQRAERPGASYFRVFRASHQPSQQLSRRSCVVLPSSFHSVRRQESPIRPTERFD